MSLHPLVAAQDAIDTDATSPEAIRALLLLCQGQHHRINDCQRQINDLRDRIGDLDGLNA